MKKPLCSLTSRRTNRQSVFWSFVDQQTSKLAASMAEMMLQLQLQAHLKAGWNQRSDQRTGYRNGYYRRQLVSPHGPLTIKVPRCRDSSFDPNVVFDRYQRRLSDVEAVLRHSYLLGASTRGVAQLAEQIFGGSVSHQTVSRLMRWLDGELLKWRNQPIEGHYSVVYIDGMHVNRLGSDRVVMLVAGRRPDGRLEVLDFSVSRGERCVELLAALRRRGLEGVELFVSDDSAAIGSALEQVYPEVPRQDCVFHRLSRLRAKIGPAVYRDQMVAEAACVFRCDSETAALSVAGIWRRKWQPICPVGVRQFIEGLCKSLAFFGLPQKRWKRVRTNNPMENLIRQLRRRLNPMGCFHDDAAIERAVFGQLLRSGKIKLTHNT